MARWTRMFLIRHGRVEDAWAQRIYGDLDVSLDAVGEREAVLAVERLAGVVLAGVVSSGLARAEFGAALLRAGRGLERREDPRLREIGRGAWRGLSFDELEAGEPGAMAAWRSDPCMAPEGGESLVQLEARVLPAIEDLVGEFAGEQVAIVGHSWVIRVVVCAVLGMGPGGARRLELGTGEMAVIDWPAEGAGLRPTLVGLGAARVPSRGEPWHRGPHRG